MFGLSRFFNRLRPSPATSESDVESVIIFSDVRHVLPAEFFSEREIVSLAAGLGISLVHPLAEPMIRAATERGVAVASFDDVRVHEDKGLIGTMGENVFVLGDQDMAEQNQIVIPPLEKNRLAVHGPDGKAVFILTKDGVYLGAFVVA
jgi:Cu+-exporting ATPase